VGYFFSKKFFKPPGKNFFKRNENVVDPTSGVLSLWETKLPHPVLLPTLF